MKKVLILIFSLVYTLACKAQQTSKDIYLTQPDLKRFTGEWQYLSHDTTFLISLKLVKTFVKNGDGFYIDLIQGDYTLKIGGQVLQSSVGCSTIKSGGYVDKDKSKDRVKFIFYDLGRKLKSGDVVLELSKGIGNTANWSLTNRETVIIGPEKPDYTFSVPTKATFKKIE
ncbi:hypothetical protein ACVW0P_000355 [Mucilaginibacter sp. UYNi724]